jgi:uncharacterized protein (DUF302 family)
MTSLAPGLSRRARETSSRFGRPAELATLHFNLPAMNTDLLITRRTRQSLEAVCARLPAVAQQHKFGVLGTHDLKEKMLSKGVPFERECRVFEVCNPHQAQAVLVQAMEISTALPCRISVYQEDGHTVLATIKPTLLLELFEAPEARAVAREVETALTRIMDDVAGAPA